MKCQKSVAYYLCQCDSYKICIYLMALELFNIKPWGIYCRGFSKFLLYWSFPISFMDTLIIQKVGKKPGYYSDDYWDLS